MACEGLARPRQSRQRLDKIWKLRRREHAQRRQIRGQRIGIDLDHEDGLLQCHDRAHRDAVSLVPVRHHRDVVGGHRKVRAVDGLAKGSLLEIGRPRVDRKARSLDHFHRSRKRYP